MVVQLEIKMELSIAALKLAKKHGLLTILNPAPAPTNSDTNQPSLPKELLDNTDIIIPNEIEALSLCHFNPESDILFPTNKTQNNEENNSSQDSAIALHTIHSTLHSLSSTLACVLLTLGSHGASYTFSSGLFLIFLIS